MRDSQKYYASEEIPDSAYWDCGRQAQSRFEVLKDSESLPVLSASGCVLVAADTAGFSPKSSLTVTDLGARILRVLHAYLVAMDGADG